MTQLQRTLGPVMIWGLGVGYVISGMYFGWNGGLPEGGPYGMLVATAAVTVLYVTFVLGYAELACALPRAGGAFVYASRAFGPHVGFLAGAAQLVEYVLAPVGIAFAIGAYVNQTLEVPVLVVAFATYIIFTAVNIIGVRLSVAFELVLAIVAIFELLVFGTVVLPHFSWDKFTTEPLPTGWWGAFAALPFAMWFYLAIEGIANVAEEARSPQRDLPRGFIAAMATLVVLTMITLFGAVGVDGWRSVVYVDGIGGDESDSPLPLAIAHVVARDNPLFYALTGIGLVGLIASFHGILIAASRAMLEFGRASYLPRVLGEVHPKTRTPVIALLVNMAVGCVALLTGKTNDIIYLSVLGALTLYILSTASVLRLRRSEPELERPYRTPGYPATPIAALGLSLICMAAMIIAHPLHALIYAVTLGVGWGLFAVLVPPERRTRF